MPTCMVDDSFDFTAGCSDPMECEYDIIDYSIEAYANYVDTYSSSGEPQIIGIAKDGHLVTGPYNKDGNKWC